MQQEGVNMEIIQNILTANNCYKSGKRLNPTRLMVHSTAVPGAPAKNFLNSWNTPKPNGREVCVHGFVDNTGIYQTLPWTIQAWHCGGSGNQTAIGAELCEPKDYGDRAYFDAVIKNAIQLYAYLAKTYGISVNNIISHKEGHALGIASNHGDPDHWWNYVGYTMDKFRADVKSCMDSGNVSVSTNGGVSTITNTSGTSGGAGVVFTYAVKLTDGTILPFVQNLADFAGLVGRTIAGIAIKVNKGSVKYRVHVKGKGWLPYVTGCDWNDIVNGWAGYNGAVIDAVEVYYYTPDDIVRKYGYQKAQYRVSPLNGNYWPWQYDNETGGGQDGFAGVIGKAIDRFQLF